MNENSTDTNVIIGRMPRQSRSIIGTFCLCLLLLTAGFAAGYFFRSHELISKQVLASDIRYLTLDDDQSDDAPGNVNTLLSRVSSPAPACSPESLEKNRARIASYLQTHTAPQKQHEQTITNVPTTPPGSESESSTTRLHNPAPSEAAPPSQEADAEDNTNTADIHDGQPPKPTEAIASAIDQTTTGANTYNETDPLPNQPPITTNGILEDITSTGPNADTNGNEQPADADSDGVLDSRDLCPNTPPCDRSG